LALTLGAHHVQVGTGQFAIAQPVGLVVSVSGIPAYVARDSPTPVLYHRMGWLNLGHALGWQQKIDLVHVPQLVYPVAPEFTILRVNLLAGETATVDEIASSTSTQALMQPWDRSPVGVTLQAVQNEAGSQSVTLWTYTVPVGRMLFLATAMLSIVRTAAATAPLQASPAITRNGLPLLEIVDYTNIVNTEKTQSLAPGGMVLLPGEVLGATYFSNDAGGSRLVTALASGFTFLV
jgi:hypothetical protein